MSKPLEPEVAVEVWEADDELVVGVGVSVNIVISVTVRKPANVRLIISVVNVLTVVQRAGGGPVVIGGPLVVVMVGVRLAAGEI